MKSFDYMIADPAGIHPRSAGDLVKQIKGWAGVCVTIAGGEKRADARKLMEIVNMGLKQGDTVTVSVEGENEDEIAARIEEFFKTYF